MQALFVARRRYADLRRRLDPERDTDRELHDELTRLIRSLELKIAAGGAETRCAAAAISPEGDLPHRAGLRPRSKNQRS